MTTARAWADMFCKAKTREKRQAIWKQVPDHLKPLVRRHAQIWKARNED